MRRGVYRFLRGAVRLFSPHYTLLGAENLPAGGCVVVANHCQMYGPIAAELYLPGKHRIWCVHEMMDKALVPAYAYRDFWSQKPPWQRPFWRFFARLIAPLAELVFTENRCIPVYRDLRVSETLRLTRDALTAGERVVIFPEQPEAHNRIVHAFQEGFVDTGRQYARSTGQRLRFVPLYICPALKTMVFGRPVTFNPDAPIRAERGRIAGACMAEITRLAESLPRHRVVPYPNIPKSAYPMSKETRP